MSSVTSQLTVEKQDLLLFVSSNKRIRNYCNGDLEFILLSRTKFASNMKKKYINHIIKAFRNIALTHFLYIGILLGSSISYQ